jgi:hypothetical protein
MLANETDQRHYNCNTEYTTDRNSRTEGSRRSQQHPPPAFAAFLSSDGPMTMLSPWDGLIGSTDGSSDLAETIR